jgi:peptidoglycan hydrolase FlgJ
MGPLAIGSLASVAAYRAAAPQAPATGEKAWAQAQDFEAVFVSSMIGHMFTGIGNDGPLGNGVGVGVWRSSLTDAFAKNLVRSGGLGIAQQVYKSMLARQSMPAA